MTGVLAIVAALCLSTLLQPATAIAGVFCMFGFEQWAMATDPDFFAAEEHRSLINRVIGFIVLLGLAKKIYRGHPILPGYPAVGLLVFTLFSYALLSTLWAPNPARSLSIFLARAPFIVTLVFFAPLLCSSTVDIERMLTATFIFGTLMLLLLMFTVEWKSRLIVFPGRGFSGNPLEAGTLGGTTAIIATFLSWPKFKFFNTLRWTVVALGLILTVRSGSRGQTLALIMVICACWPIAHRLESFKAYTILGCVVVFLVTGTFWGVDAYWSVSERWTPDNALDEATSTRLNPSSQVLDHWFTTPATIFFGLGSSASYDIIGFYSHVVLVDILAEEGILGFLIYVGIVLSCLKSGLRSFSLARYIPVQRAQLAVLCAILLYNFFLSLKQGSLLTNTVPFMAAILMGNYEKALLHHHHHHHHRRVQVIERDHY